MNVIIAKDAGICFGVRRALDLVTQEAAKGRPLATLGPLIHNPQVVRELESRGVRPVKSVDEASDGLVMPSHGATRDVWEAAQNAGLRILDATCPFVAKVHERVHVLSDSGYFVVVVGDPGHSEVKAILSAAGHKAAVVSGLGDAESIDWSDKRVGIVSQTTQTPERFGEVVGFIASRAPELVSYNTICYATHKRQKAARELARSVEAMVVVGGRNSANTNRLAEICREAGVPTFHIESVSEIPDGELAGFKTVGLTAGASTPEWIIEEVKNHLEKL